MVVLEAMENVLLKGIVLVVLIAEIVVLVVVEVVIVEIAGGGGGGGGVGIIKRHCDGWMDRGNPSDSDAIGCDSCLLCGSGGSMNLGLVSKLIGTPQQQKKRRGE